MPVSMSYSFTEAVLNRKPIEQAFKRDPILRNVFSKMHKVAADGLTNVVPVVMGNTFDWNVKGSTGAIPTTGTLITAQGSVTNYTLLSTIELDNDDYKKMQKLPQDQLTLRVNEVSDMISNSLAGAFERKLLGKSNDRLCYVVSDGATPSVLTLYGFDGDQLPASHPAWDLIRVGAGTDANSARYDLVGDANGTDPDADGLNFYITAINRAAGTVTASAAITAAAPATYILRRYAPTQADGTVSVTYSGVYDVTGTASYLGLAPSTAGYEAWAGPVVNAASNPLSMIHIAEAGQYLDSKDAVLLCDPGALAQMDAGVQKFVTTMTNGLGFTERVYADGVFSLKLLPSRWLLGTGDAFIVQPEYWSIAGSVLMPEFTYPNFQAKTGYDFVYNTLRVRGNFVCRKRSSVVRIYGLTQAF